eukprot:Pompholyxophrys_punicea_v1_NODE_71_length_3757_cov_5.265460.p2 type:complete len:174 gc:universal NODE_71_length_3757_cov_5.265460:1454-1975(+)
MVEFHVDKLSDGLFHTVRENLKFGGNVSVRMATSTSCDYNHPVAICKCNKPAYHMGQDESIYKAYLSTSKEWSVDGLKTLRKKCEGPGMMVSAFQDEIRGFGFPMSPEELKTFNEHRKSCRKTVFSSSPGIEFLSYGKGKEGYWDYEKLAVQTTNILDAFEFFYPNHQFNWRI